MDHSEPTRIFLKAHAIWHELQLLFLIDFQILANLVNKNLKVDIHPTCPIYTNLSP